MTNSIISIPIAEWESFKNSLPVVLQLRTKKKTGYKVIYYRCKDKCGFEMRVTETETETMLEIELKNRDNHGNATDNNENVEPNNENVNGDQRGIHSQIKDIIIDLVEAHK